MAVHCLRDRTSLPSTAIAARTIPGRMPERGTAPGGAATQKRLCAHFLRPLPGHRAGLRRWLRSGKPLPRMSTRRGADFFVPMGCLGPHWRRGTCAGPACHLRPPAIRPRPARCTPPLAGRPASVPLVKANRLRDLPARRRWRLQGFYSESGRANKIRGQNGWLTPDCPGDRASLRRRNAYPRGCPRY